MQGKQRYKRILLKLSGEQLMGEESFGIDPNVLDNMVSEISRVVEAGVQVGLVVGGGNLFRPPIQLSLQIPHPLMEMV